MALLFADSFDNMSATADVTDRWHNTYTGGDYVYSSTLGPWGGGCMLGPDDQPMIGQSIKGHTGGSGQSIFIGFWYRQGQSAGGREYMFGLYGSNGNETGTSISQDSGLYFLYSEHDGSISMVSATFNVQPPCPAMTIKAFRWHWIEMKYTIGNSTAGSFSLRVDGTLAVEVTATDTVADTTSHLSVGGFAIGGSGNSSITADNTRISHVVVWDDTGSAFNDWMGPMKTEMLWPSADGTNLANSFTRSAGTTHFDLVNENGAPDDDTTYVESTTVAHVDGYAVDNLPETPTTIHAVCVSGNLTATSTTNREFVFKVHDGTSGADGPSMIAPNGGAYNWQQTPFYTKPSGGAWTEATVNGMEIGIEVKT
jgi:hypothetical protein